MHRPPKSASAAQCRVLTLLCDSGIGNDDGDPTRASILRLRMRLVTANVSLGRRPWRAALALLGLGVVLAWVPGTAHAYSCGTVVYHYDVGDGYSYHASFQGLDYRSGISVHGMRCSDARSFVLRYARAGFSYATFRTDFAPPGYLTRFRCHRMRDGDDVGRDYCARGNMLVFFSDWIGQFDNL